MKEMLFSRSDHESQIGKNARRMMMQLSISIDEDIQKTLSFFEKVWPMHELHLLKDYFFPFYSYNFRDFITSNLKFLSLSSDGSKTRWSQHAGIYRYIFTLPG